VDISCGLHLITHAAKGKSLIPGENGGPVTISHSSAWGLSGAGSSDQVSWRNRGRQAVKHFTAAQQLPHLGINELFWRHILAIKVGEWEIVSGMEL